MKGRGREQGLPPRAEGTAPADGSPERRGLTLAPPSADPSANVASGELPGPESVRFGSDGLVPAIVIDAATQRVLMLGYMDAKALEATRRTGEVHFYSRSRRRLWRKGETSGHVLRLRDIALDCDADALLVRAEPTGPTCHRGTVSCFDPEPTEGSGLPSGRLAAEHAEPPTSGPASTAPTESVESAFGWLGVLWATIAERAASRPPGSYTARLLDEGTEAVGRKVVEEAVEVLLAAKDDALEGPSAGRGALDAPARSALAAEAADLLYHLLVLLAERAISPEEVIEVLRRRHRP